VDHLARAFEIDALAEIVTAEPDRETRRPEPPEIANLHESILSGRARDGIVLWPADVEAARHGARTKRARQKSDPGQTRRRRDRWGV